MNNQDPRNPVSPDIQQSSIDGLPVRAFCRRCGSPLAPQAGFCRNCGQPRNGTAAAAYQPFAAPTPAVRPPRKAGPAVLIAGIAGGIVILALLILFVLALADRGFDRLDLGRSKVLTGQDVPASGGTIILDDPDSGLDGLSLAVPDGAYPEEQSFTVSETPIEGHQFGDLFEPITPLITIDNDHAVAAVPMILTIPIERADDEFAMAFFYDQQNGDLAGIPCLDQDNRSITIATAHFSSIVVSKVKKSLLEGRILQDEATTDFMPGMSDFAAPNHGSIIAASGHCTGQSLAAIHYYNENANDNYTGKTLRGEDRVDNGPLAATPGFWEDDALAYRFCSLLQKTFNWNSSVTSDLFNMSEEVAYYSFGYAMALTHSPQIVVIYGQDAQGAQVGHTMVVYEVGPDGLDIADPNYPGDLKRKIDMVKDPANPLHPVTLADYLSGVDADDPGTVFTSFTYFGTYALYDYDKIAGLWQDTLNGKDVAAGLFPADASFVAITGRDDNGAPLTESLKNPMTISPLQNSLANPVSADSLLLAVPVADTDARFTFYRGTTLIGTAGANLGQNTQDWYALPLTAGDNDIGILYERKDSRGSYEYVNFYRYLIRYSETAATPSGAPTEKADLPFAGRWELSGLEITSISGGTAEFWHEITFAGSSKEKWVDAYLGDFNDLLANSDSYGDERTYMTEINIGPPVPPVSPLFEGKYFVQFNHSNYIGNYDVIIDGIKRNYRQATVPAELLADDVLAISGYDGCGGLDDDDMYLELSLILIDDQTAQGTGRTVINAHSGGTIDVGFTCTMVRKARKPRLVPEYNLP